MSVGVLLTYNFLSAREPNFLDRLVFVAISDLASAE